MKSRPFVGLEFLLVWGQPNGSRKAQGAIMSLRQIRIPCSVRDCVQTADFTRDRVTEETAKHRAKAQGWTVWGEAEKYWRCPFHSTAAIVVHQFTEVACGAEIGFNTPNPLEAGWLLELLEKTGLKVAAKMGDRFPGHHIFTVTKPGADDGAPVLFHDLIQLKADIVCQVPHRISHPA